MGWCLHFITFSHQWLWFIFLHLYTYSIYRCIIHGVMRKCIGLGDNVLMQVATAYNCVILTASNLLSKHKLCLMDIIYSIKCIGLVVWKAPNNVQKYMLILYEIWLHTVWGKYHCSTVGYACKYFSVYNLFYNEIQYLRRNINIIFSVCYHTVTACWTYFKKKYLRRNFKQFELPRCLWNLLFWWKPQC